VKNETGDELDYAVKTVLKGQTYFSNQVQKVIFRKYSNAVTKKKQKEPAMKLTGREAEIVKLISEGLTSHQMAEKLFISPRTVETHRANLMKKAGVKNSIELVKKMEKLGLI
ncbi:MAG TPA: response regulator transcription factor, partial [Cyclobacteriaceae bacterium]|nr:response regulator transcription factor [Cyclobacteriaceae bacterium]